MLESNVKDVYPAGNIKLKGLRNFTTQSVQINSLSKAMTCREKDSLNRVIPFKYWFEIFQILSLFVLAYTAMIRLLMYMFLGLSSSKLVIRASLGRFRFLMLPLDKERQRETGQNTKSIWFKWYVFGFINERSPRRCKFIKVHVLRSFADKSSKCFQPKDPV